MPSKINFKISMEQGWAAEVVASMNLRVGVIVTEATKLGAEIASQASMPRHRSGLMAEMKVIPTEQTGVGWAGGFASEAWYAGFQDRGTLGSRRGGVSAATMRRRTSESGRARSAHTAGSKGIKPLGFIEKGGAAARKLTLDGLNRL